MIVYNLLFSLLSCCRGDNDTFRNFEARLESLVAKSTLYGAHISIYEMICSLMLLCNSDLEDSANMVPIAYTFTAMRASDALSDEIKSQQDKYDQKDN